MKLEVLKNIVTSKAGRQILVLQKYSPQILFAAGVVGVVATAVATGRATLKLSEVLDEHKDNMEVLTYQADTNDMPEEERTKFKALVYTNTTVRIMKLYGPAVIIGGVSIACLTGSHHILTQRNAGLMAAYSAIEKAFGRYRDRVRQDVGSDKDREYMYGVEERTFVKQTKNGEKVVTEKHVAQDGPSGYAQLFGRDTSQSWSSDPGGNVLFLRSVQNWMNDRLRADGHLILNDVYKELGLERTQAGYVVGWLKDGDGDGYVDFGVFNREMKPEHFDFFTGVEESIWLDFNVDGVIYDKI